MLPLSSEVSFNGTECQFVLKSIFAKGSGLTTAPLVIDASSESSHEDRGSVIRDVISENFARALETISL